MARVCINCGKKIGILAKEPPLELCDGQVLCENCARSIGPKVGKLYGSKSLEEFNEIKNEILVESEKIYNLDIRNAIEKRIDEIYEHNVEGQIERENTKNIEKTNRIAEVRQKNEELENLKKLAESQMMTTGYDFSGYQIVKYAGVISGEVVLGTGFLSEFSTSFSDLFGAESSAFADKLETAKDAAIKKLALKSAEKGGNAIIGIDFDYITFASNMIGVVANGTSVVIEKVEDKLE